jgi:hypothetical protein
VGGGGGQGREMNQALYVHMNNKKKEKKIHGLYLQHSFEKTTILIKKITLLHSLKGK